MADLRETIEQAAQQPRSVTVDQTTTETRPLPELIEADRYLRQLDQASNNRSGVSFGRFRPPGVP